MQKLELVYPLDDQISYKAHFLPERGMNLSSFKKGECEVIAESTRAQFEERSSGLGPLIGPHFHRKKHPVLLKDESLFPHIAKQRAHGSQDPFSHGVARYAPWKVLESGEKIVAELKGKDEWNGVLLKDLEGQDFTMRMTASLSKVGLKLNLSIVSETGSLVGTHYYYRLPKGRSFVKSRVLELQDPLEISLETASNEVIDSTFHAEKNDPLRQEISLITEEYTLKTVCNSCQEETCWQLYSKPSEFFACIEPMSAFDPRRPHLSVTTLDIQLEILTP